MSGKNGEREKKRRRKKKIRYICFYLNTPNKIKSVCEGQN